MGATRLEDVSGQVREFWSDLIMDEVKEDTLLPSLVNKEYQGEKVVWKEEAKHCQKPYLDS